MYSYRVEWREGAGNCLVSTRPIKAGTHTAVQSIALDIAVFYHCLKPVGFCGGLPLFIPFSGCFN